MCHSLTHKHKGLVNEVRGIKHAACTGTWQRTWITIQKGACRIPAKLIYVFLNSERGHRQHGRGGKSAKGRGRQAKGRMDPGAHPEEAPGCVQSPWTRWLRQEASHSGTSSFSLCNRSLFMCISSGGVCSRVLCAAKPVHEYILVFCVRLNACIVVHAI